jgi:DNA-binding response OmpR family regulator
VKILLLEDNVRLNNTITKRLTLSGYQCDSFVDGKEAYSAIDNGYSCFILDINVPSLDGVELLKKIREFHKQTPVIIISSTVELDVIKDAYGFGCDDYLKKPFYIDELEFKIEKLCMVDGGCQMLCNDFTFDVRSNILSSSSEEYQLTKKEGALLNLLLSNKSIPVSFETIQGVVWEGNASSVDSVRTLVKRVRKYLPKDTIKTVVNVGYKI